MGRKKDITAIRQQKANQLTEKVAKVYNWSISQAQLNLSQSLKPSFRINTLKSDSAKVIDELTQLGWVGQPIHWCPHGYSIEQGYEAVRDSQLVDEGRIYIQNQSSWIPVLSLQLQPGQSVLDVCAAPGGKASHIAAVLQNKGRLVVNDNSRNRLHKLKANLDRLAVQAEYTLFDARFLASQLNVKFDRILLDAPCSGEGLLNIQQPKTLDYWSPAQVKRLSQLQKRLLSQAWQLLTPGGRLVYSTCTISPEENEVVIDWFLKRNESAKVVQPQLTIPGSLPGLLTWNNKEFDTQLSKALRLPPQHGQEAFFVCVIEKSS